jgi:hypothetical protein
MTGLQDFQINRWADYSIANAWNQRAPTGRRQKNVDRVGAAPLWLRLQGEGRGMIVAPLFGATLAIAVATGPLTSPSGQADLSAQQKIIATEPLVRSATDCIVRAVTGDPRYGNTGGPALGDLIVDSVPSCLEPVHAMIDAYDRYYGAGVGEAFFMGPYLDILPQAVLKAASKAVPAGARKAAE